MEEIWKVCDPIHGRFEASNLGRIRRVKDGHVYRQTVTKNGYAVVSCGLVHRLVLFAFKGPAPSIGHQCAHNNGEKLDNRPENLRWATPKENQADCVLHGTDSSGERNPGARFTNEQVLQIVSMKDTMTASEVGRKYDTNCQNIKNIWNGRTWRSVTGLPLVPPITRESYIAIMQTLQR